MSTDKRLIGDVAAQKFELQARAIISAAPLISGPTHDLAVAVVLLAEDRTARREMEVASGRGSER